MWSGPFQRAAESGRAAGRRRPTALLLAIAVHLAVLLLLLRLAPDMPMPEARKQGPTTVSLLPDEGEAETTTSEERKEERRESGGAKAAPSPPKPVPPEPVPPEPAPAPEPVVEYIRLTRADLRSTDRALAARAPAAASGASQGPVQTAEAGGAAGGETGPNGERLYPADWQRRPTKAELGMYLPAGVSGWGMIACRTVEGFRVEDCVELGQSPAGSGLSRAVRQAAWQFRVRPPRVGGKPQVGAWVKIRIDYLKGELK